VRIFVLDERAEGRDVADEISNDDAPVSCFRPRDAKRYMGGCDRIGRSDDNCGVTAQQ
jgi:hypothetical protein